ncbi:MULTISPECIES: GNAT family N-acetyltransferase [unclassified Bosea (in: a-proteobacteria)]|uniref:GNAT family N-acetyltransferase n=1 Tax=unclassified Bosea (in: a-proteobacteria) TaxID=2653178 RepID=UPI000956ACBA|nr:MULTISPECIES: GNAT family N-acetyltransferase [unclassified Bosea (in: a-proteobacteria)]TAJ29737.1 MAG: GNAT family N-acetyltransferase [Bosea sp. (in: a-proteobacteria)]SIQ58974.1 Predicted N-acetyltransferase YhbS [Bosea sp. TND4EK4]
MATLQRETDVAATREAVIAGLSAYNAARIGPRNGVPLALSLRDDDGAIVGGLIGELKWQWLHVDLLWIDESQRGAGHGEGLVALAEAAARDHGARGVYLSTMSIQAPEFYPRLGYKPCGVMEDYPVAGQRLHHFTKAL